jgi:FAD/FMN-containing dehydrogenase
MTTTFVQNQALFKDLTALLTGQLLLPDDAAYEQVRHLWNGKVKTQPAALVRCLTVPDVIHTVRWTRAHGLPLAVRGGGHDFAGRALVENGVVIDLSQMKAVTIDPDARTALIQGGSTAGDLIEAAQKYGLATATGSVSSVGMSGFTLGGGYGSLMGAYGLAADNLLSAQVVTADGQLVTANAQEHPDLFWGLRGGGGNFGVVVSLEYRLHPLATVLSGMLLYPLEQARTVLHRFNEFIATAPDELTIPSGFLQMPDGLPALFLSPTYCGSLAAGERAIAPLRTFGDLLVDSPGGEASPTGATRHV